MNGSTENRGNQNVRVLILRMGSDQRRIQCWSYFDGWILLCLPRDLALRSPFLGGTSLAVLLEVPILSAGSGQFKIAGCPPESPSDIQSS